MAYKVVCSGCGHWIRNNTWHQAENVAEENGWHGSLCHSKDHKFGTYLWFCPSCQKKVTLYDLQNIIKDVRRRREQEWKQEWERAQKRNKEVICQISTQG